MARRYDARTTIFSPEGRLYQVEYAMEAINHAGTCLGILTNEGIVLGAEKKVTSKLLDVSRTAEKLYYLSEHVICSVAGITSDANILIEYAREAAQRHALVYYEPVPVEQMVQQLCNLKQGYTQVGGLRPFGVSFLYAGWDKHHGYQLYQSDPSGNYSGWKATCIGNNHQAAQSLLKQDYKESMTLVEAEEMAIKILCKSMDTATLTADKLEFATLSKKNGKLKYHIYNPTEVDELLKRTNVVEAMREKE